MIERPLYLKSTSVIPPVGVFAVYEYYKNGNVNIWYALYIAIMFTIGSFIMSKIGVKINKNIRHIFNWSWYIHICR